MAALAASITAVAARAALTLHTLCPCVAHPLSLCTAVSKFQRAPSNH